VAGVRKWLMRAGLMLRNDQAGQAAGRPGALIAEWRRLAGLTQQQLADRAAVSVGMVRDLEQGRTSRPRGDTAETLARVLGVDPSRLSDAAGWPPANGHAPALTEADQAAHGVRLGVLGSLALWHDGVATDLGAGRQRAVLGLLAMYPGTAVHRRTIIDVVWGHRPPASAVPMVQTYASRLRRLLGEDLLVSDGISYRLALAVGQLDALEFAMLAGRADQAAAAGNHGAACRCYEAALRLWRGEPLDDVSAMRGHPAVTSLAQQRTLVILDHAAAAAAAGRPEQVLPQLQALAADDPLDERVHARLMLTLAACGQQAAALSVFAQVRERLSDELGIIPGAELMEAHLRILRGKVRSPGAAIADRARMPRFVEHVSDGNGAADQATDQARRKAARPRQLPAAVAQFTGRARELALLSRLAGQAARGTVVISAIGGMAGIGKTALAVHWAHRVAGRFPGGQLYANLRGFGLSGAPARPDEVIRGFLEALDVPPGQIPAGLDAQAALYRGATAGRRLLIVLDNARDEQQVRPLLPSSPGCLVLVTSRHQLTGLSAAEGAQLLTLDVLTGDDASALLIARIGADRAAGDPAAVAEIAALCGHLPLALAVTAARAAVRPRFTMAALATELRDARGRLTALDTGDPAVSVRAVFSWSYAQLAPGTARTFRLLGLHPGPSISLPAAASLAGIAPGQVRRHLAELARAHLVTETCPGRYTLHDLLRAYAAERAEATDGEADRRATVHRMLDHYLHSADAASALLYPARGLAALGAPQPGVTPETMTDERAALAWLSAEHRVIMAVIPRAADAGFDAHAQQLPEVLATHLDRRGLWDDCAGAQRVSLAAAERQGDLASQARALRFLGRSRIRLGAYEDGYAHLTRAMDLFHEAGDDLGRARCHLTLSMGLRSQGRVGESLGHTEQALRLFRTVGHRAGEAAALADLGSRHAALGACELALAEGARSLDLHRELRNRDGQAEAWTALAEAHRRLGHQAEALNCYRQAVSLLDELGQPYNKAAVLTDLGDAYHAAGRAEEARQAWQQAASILEGLRHPDAEQIRARLAAGA
jgi:DNA-binding SARP family transcriptional activator/transcriptional regulator with XRE-family HTH domain